MIDQIGEGLKVLGFKKLLVSFPDDMEHLFVGGTLAPANQDLVEMLQAPDVMSESQGTTFRLLQEYILELDEEGELFSNN